jgi:hypothetical protein
VSILAIKNKIMPTDELSEKGECLYKKINVSDDIEKKYKGHTIVIEVESGKYFIDENTIIALEDAKKAFPEKEFYMTRIGGAAHLSLFFSESFL